MDKLTVAYARVSSREQSEDTHALEQQISRLQACDVDHLYCDVESGANPDRPAFLQMIDAVKQGKIGKIIATRWDRITRDETTYLEFKRMLQKYQIFLELLNQGPVDLSTAFGETSSDLQAIFASHELRMLQERIKQGYKYRRQKKKACARAPWGYENKDDCYVLDSTPIICLLEQQPAQLADFYEAEDCVQGISRADIAREVINFLLEGYSLQKTLKCLYERYGVVQKKKQNHRKGESGTRIKQLNPIISHELLFWNSGSNLRDWVQNPVLRGHTCYQKWDSKRRKKPPEEWEWHYNTHPDQTLLTEEEFQVIQDYLARRSKPIQAPQTKFYLTGLVVCHSCGHTSMLRRSQAYVYYGCRHSSSGCQNHGNIKVECLEHAVAQALQIRAVELADQAQHGSLSPSPIEISELNRLQQELDGMNGLLLVQPDNSALKQAIYTTQAKVEALQHQDDLSKFQAATADELIRLPAAQDLGFWFSLCQAEREIFYTKLVKKIVFQDRRVVSVTLLV